MSRRVVIVGAGVIGCCCALEARRRGWEVVVVDRGRPQDEGCSFGNAGMVVPSHFIPLAAPGMVAMGLRMMGNPESPFFLKPRLDADLASWVWRFVRAATRRHVESSAPLLRDLSLASRALYVEWSREWGDPFGLQERGLLMLCKSDHGLEEEAGTAARARDLGLRAEVLDPRQLAALEPGLRMDVAGGVYFPQDCHLSPGAFLSALRGKLAAEGVEFRWNFEARGWKGEASAPRALTGADGEVGGDVFVLAAGVWSTELAKLLGCALPMQAGKGYSVTLDNPRERPAVCAILTEARVAVTPMGGGLRFGGTMEISGLDERVNPRRLEGIAKSVPRYFPAFTAADLRGCPVWHGLRPCSPDGLPYLGALRRAPNVIAATGHAMMGLSLAPITGNLVASLLDGRAPSIDISLLDPCRFD